VTYIIVLLVLLAIIALYIRNQKSRTGTQTEAIGSGPLPYMKKDYLLTRAERAFYDVLMIALAGRYNVFAKVRMLDLFYLPKGTKNRMGWNGRIIQKHVDFVICDPKTLGPVTCIELDDASHDVEERQERDAFIDKVFEASGLKLHHVRAAISYDPGAIKTMIGIPS
jgi:Protein of unknown function (DUF2726)